MKKTIVFFGDSICAGYRAAPGQGWVERLAALRPDLEVINAGVSGETSKDALRRFDSAVTAHAPDMVYIQFGLNDASWWCRQPGKSWLSEEDYIATMRTLIARCATIGALTFVATNHPVINAGERAERPEETAEASNPSQPSYAAQVRRYNAALRTALATENVILVDMEKAILDSGPPPAELLDPDGVHLNRHGNIYYTRTVAEVLQLHIQ